MKRKNRKTVGKDKFHYRDVKGWRRYFGGLDLEVVQYDIYGT